MDDILRLEHEPYWSRGGFVEFAGWAPVVPVTNEIWLPVVRGQGSRDAAFQAFVLAFDE